MLRIAFLGIRTAVLTTTMFCLSPDFGRTARMLQRQWTSCTRDLVGCIPLPIRAEGDSLQKRGCLVASSRKVRSVTMPLHHGAHFITTASMQGYIKVCALNA